MATHSSSHPTISTDTECQTTLDCLAFLMEEKHLSAWFSATQIANELLKLEPNSREPVINQIKQRKVEQTAHEDTDKPSPQPNSLSGFVKNLLTLPPINKEHLHNKAEMLKENEQLILALIGSTSTLNLGSRILRIGELPEFGKLISEEGMNSDVYAYGETQVVKYVRYGADAAKLLAESINKLALDQRLSDIVLPVSMLKEGGAHLIQERIPISYLSLEHNDKLDELVTIAREILDIPNHGPDKSIYVGRFRLLIDNQPTNITDKLQWYDPVYLSISHER